jgi:tRNA1Val (adenine37-N6)-methyltransferase
MEGDVRLPPMELARGFDVVLANPPYRRAGAGRQALVEERARARHEVAGGLNDFLRAAAHMLRDGGRFYVVFLAERLTELLTGMRTHRLEPKRLRSIQSRAGDDACLVLVEGRKGAGSDGLSIMPPLIIYAGAEYTAEIDSIFGGEQES